MECHEHQRNRAVATREGPDAFCDSLLDDFQIDWVENDDRVIPHPQSRCSIDPVPIPPQTAKLFVHSRGVVTTLGRDNCIHFRKHLQVVCVLQNPCRSSDFRGLSPGIGR